MTQVVGQGQEGVVERKEEGREEKRESRNTDFKGNTQIR